MKWFFDPCRSRRQQVSLLAAKALPDAEKDQVLNHLAACPDCQKYFNEIKSVAASLGDAKAEFANLKLAPAAHARWTAAITAAGSTVPVSGRTTASALREWYMDVIWPYRRVWTGLATVWVLIFVGHASLHESSGVVMAKSSKPVQQQMIMALKDRQAVLAELLGGHFPPPDADRPKFFSPKPRTEWTRIFMT